MNDITTISILWIVISAEIFYLLKFEKKKGHLLTAGILIGLAAAFTIMILLEKRSW